MDNNSNYKDNNQNQQKKELITILFCGNSGVGKSTLIEKFISSIFIERQIVTIGVDHRLIKIKINNEEVQLKIIDIPGKLSYLSVVPQCLRKADGFVYVYDVCNMESFEDIKNWLNQTKLYANEGIECILIGNKVDLEQQVSFNKGNEFASENVMQFFETSAKSGRDVENSITYLAQKIFCKRLNQRLSEQRNIKQQENNKNQKLNSQSKQIESRSRCWFF